eukprot:323649-Pleurochrysis_carterae.AAC.1
MKPVKKAAAADIFGKYWRIASHRCGREECRRKEVKLVGNAAAADVFARQQGAERDSWLRQGMPKRQRPSGKVVQGSVVTVGHDAD